MHKILITGAGKIGSLIACLLLESKDYEVHIADINFFGSDIARLLQTDSKLHSIEIDVTKQEDLIAYIKTHNIQAVISSLPYYVNVNVAKAARESNIHYFDLTEDTAVTAAVKQISQNETSAFIPQCGLAPGFINIVANSLMLEFEELESAELRVGALPQAANNALHYALTWSTEGVINQYGNACYAIEQGENATLPPLGGLEHIQLDGLSYEAFNTSGGLGSLADTYKGKIKTLNYKTIRYPGHCEKMQVLMYDLKLNEDRKTLQRILENAIPKTYQDVVLVYVSVTGKIANVYLEKSYVKKIYPQIIAEMSWTAIQVTTASSICVIVDTVLTNPEKYKGLVRQEDFALQTFLANRFGRYYI